MSWVVAAPKEPLPSPFKSATPAEKIKCQEIANGFIQYITDLNNEDVRTHIIDKFSFNAKVIACREGVEVLVITRLEASVFMVNEYGIKEEICIFKKDLVFLDKKGELVTSRIATSFPLIGPGPCAEVRKQIEKD